MRGSFLKGVAVGAVCVLVGGVATVALAGSGVGGVFNLGVSNSVDAKTTLTGASPGIQLQVANTSAAAGTSGLAVNSGSGATTGVFTNTGGGPAGGFFVNAGVKPFTVNSQTRVGNLNADLLDGLDSPALQKRVTGTCAVGTAVRVLNANGTVACQALGTGAAAPTFLAGSSGGETPRDQDFVGVGGHSGLSGPSEQIMPVAGTLHNLYVRLSGSPTAGNTFEFAIILNGAFYNFHCEIADTANSCSNTSSSLSFSAGDTICLWIDQVVGSGGTLSPVTWSVQTNWAA
jgi:hypothetical protein